MPGEELIEEIEIEFCALGCGEPGEELLGGALLSAVNGLNNQREMP